MLTHLWPVSAALLIVPLAVPALPEPASVSDARARLKQLTVGRPGSLAGYSHARFMPEWQEQEGPCDTREVVLRRDALSYRTDLECRAVHGRWHSPYDGMTLTSETQIDVDHLVPLSNAWRSGADKWSDARRHAFANDLTRPELIAVSERANVAKGGRSPITWRPPRRDYWCTYARAWIDVKHHYRLRVTANERAALAHMLRTCG
ncbi:HNH endonuclease [Nonomuraea sp. NN258]|uniref:HNH endonuclease family protein n=1 Tax=Nonomuraea antri TaxID=2730852 RepID=UPI0015692C27|nr:HNH endonuclease family protein [Nonomuraea antri]NRQ31626.1 HNH endonuclease [Nonomuraea antri]